MFTKAKYMLGVVLLIGVSGCSNNQRPSTTSTQVTINQAAKTLLYLPLYVAIDKGYLQQQGIDAKIATGGGDSQAFASLASGQAQFAQGDPTFVAISHEKGGPGVLIASVLDRVAFYGVSFDPKLSSFSDPKNFKGLTVVTYPEPNTAYVVQKALLRRAGLTLGKNSFITQAAFGTELGPLQANAAQIAVSIEPTVSQAESKGARVVYSYPKAWGPFLLTGLMTTEDFAKQHPDIVHKVVSAYEQALRLIRKDPEAAVQVGQKYFPEVDAGTIRQAIARLVQDDVFPQHAAVDINSWNATLRLRQQLGDLKSADHADLIDNSYAAAAQQSTQ